MMEITREEIASSHGSIPKIIIDESKIYFVTGGFPLSSYSAYEYDGTGDPVEIGTTDSSSSEPNIANAILNGIRYNDEFYLSYHDDTNGNELWRWSEDSTNLVADIRPGSDGSNPGDFFIFQNNLYFSAETDESGRELYSYNGIDPPTLVADINPGPGSSDPQLDDVAKIYKGELYFAAEHESGLALWKYDGSQHPILVHDNIGSLNWYYDEELEVFNEKLYFNAKQDDNSYGIWMYDGENPPEVFITVNMSWSMKAVNNTLYFSGDRNDGRGQELWKYNGVDEPVRLTDINPGTGDSSPAGFTLFNDKVYFSAYKGDPWYVNPPRGLYVYDPNKKLGPFNYQLFYPAFLKMPAKN
jgi:ELWxxDGT repeat protein